MTDIRLDYAVPSAGVADYITLFYDFYSDHPVFEDTERADHAQIRFRLSPGGALYRLSDGSEQHAAPIHIVGPKTVAMHVRVEGPARVFGAGITPMGWSAMIGNDASTMLNRVIDATDIFGAPALDMAMARLTEAPDLTAMVAIGEALVRTLVRKENGGALEFVRQVDAWLADSVSPEIEALIAETGLSRRQIERKCKILYGAPPKLLARKYRALRAAVALLSEGASLDDVLERGFYDQSHLIREIKQFTGYTPRQMKAEPTILAQLTIGQRHALGGQVNSLISDT